MTSMHRDCGVVQRLWLEQTLGRSLEAAELSLCSRHVESCAACRAESEAMRRIGDLDGAGPAPALDDLSRRRWIDTVLSKAEDAFAEDLKERRRELPRVVGIAGIAAAAAIAAFVAVWFSRGEAPPPSAETRVADALPKPAVGRVLLTSGETTMTGGLEGGEIAVGSDVATGTGFAVAAMDGGVLLRLGPETAVEILRSTPASSEVRLEKGTLLVSVDPNRKGRKFRVLAGDGAVEVKGTIFQVERDEKDAISVSVFRGEVLVSGRGGERAVRLGEKIELGNPEIAAFGEDERRGVESAMDSLSALAAERFAVLEIESLPRGASVSVDGIEIGATPLTVSLRPGYRRLSLRLDGRESVRELLRLAEGSKTSRSFDLAAATPPDEETSSGSRGAIVSGGERTASSAERAPSPNQLLATARDLRAAGDFTGAIAAYERLVAAYPDAPVARAALVSLGQLYLDQGGNPERGLALFRKYLASAHKGALAQEAAFGVATACRALGDTAAEREALEAFLRDYADANQAPRARARLEQIR